MIHHIWYHEHNKIPCLFTCSHVAARDNSKRGNTFESNIFSHKHQIFLICVSARFEKLLMLAWSPHGLNHCCRHISYKHKHTFNLHVFFNTLSQWYVSVGFSLFLRWMYYALHSVSDVDLLPTDWLHIVSINAPVSRVTVRCYFWMSAGV